MNKPSSRLKRALNPMPKDVLETLEKEKLVDNYYARPPYQRNDYISWITRAKRNETREKRLLQMIDELKDGGLYMKMKYNPMRKKD
jgi:uncharacterized protein YdeI (YjbR/CyaY-like superfamily)